MTDNGNFVIDAPFDRENMIDPFTVSLSLFSVGRSSRPFNPITVDHDTGQNVDGCS